MVLVIAVVRGRGGLGTGLLRPPKTPERRLGPGSGLRSCLGIAGSAAWLGASTPRCQRWRLIGALDDADVLEHTLLA